MKVSTNNDWGKLREIIVGRADGARIPTVDKSTMSFSYASHSVDEVKKFEGPLPQVIIDEANEDIEELVNVLLKSGVKVHRPEDMDTAKVFETPYWSTTGWYSWCPRDLLLPLDNIMIETPSPTRARYFEVHAYHNIMLEAVNDGVEWIAGPKSKLLDEAFSFADLSKPTLMNTEPLFDAPNIVRIGRDLLFQVSNSGNKLGLKWLRNVLEPRGYRIHEADALYSFAHFDSTIIPLRPGLVLLNSTRVNPQNCPRIFSKWDKIYFSDVVGVESPYKQYDSVMPCSPYIALNVLSIDESTVCVEKHQAPLMRALEAKGITCVPLPMRHSRLLSGGFHCATLDLVRDGEKIDYIS